MTHAFPLATASIVALLISPGFGNAATITATAHSRYPNKVTIVSGGASQSDLHLNWFRDFDNFESEHAIIARDLGRNPVLVRSSKFRSEHPEWATFLTDHPGLCADIDANPGNYLVITPRVVNTSKQAQEAKQMEQSHTKAKA